MSISAAFNIRNGGLATVSAIALCIVALPAPALAQENELSGDIRFSWWGSQARNEKTDQIILMFESEHPGVTIAREVSDFSPHWEKLSIQSAGGSQPCSIQMQTRYLATFARPDVLRPLDDLIASGDLDVTGIAAPIIEGARGDDGSLYMIPTGVFYFALMYNETMAQEAEANGVALLPDPYSWNDLADYLRAIAPHLPDDVIPTHNMGRETDAFVSWVQSQGDAVFDGSQIAFQRQTVIDWFTYWETLRTEGLTDSPEVMIADTGSLVEESNLANARTFLTNRPPNRLGSMQAVLETVSPGSRLGIIPYPTGEDGTVGMDLGSNGMAIGASCDEDLIPATTAWINFFTQDPRAAAIYQSDNGVVSVDALATVQAADPATNPGQARNIELFQQVVAEASPIPWPAGGYQAVTDTLNRAYDAVAFGVATPEDAADQFMTELQQQLDTAVN